MWDALRWERCYVLRGNIDTIRATAVFHPNGKNFVTASWDGRVLLWDVKRGEQLFSFSTTKHLDTTLYKGRAEDIQRVIEQQKSDSRGTSGLTFSPCGTLLVGAIRDEGEIRVWDAWKPAGEHAKRATFAATEMLRVTPGNAPVAKAFAWMKTELPDTAVVAARWGSAVN